MNPRLLVVTGMIREARVIGGPRVRVVTGGGSPFALEGRLATTEPERLGAVVSFGLAGGLDPALPVGSLLLAAEIVAPGSRWETSSAITTRWREKLAEAGEPAHEAVIAGSDAPLLSIDAKTELRARTGAAAVDMESHVAAAFAARHRLPFGALRVISDEANHALPAVAGSAMRPDGSIDVVGVLAGLARSPGQIPALLATARDAAVAFRRLRRVRSLLGELLGLDL